MTILVGWSLHFDLKRAVGSFLAVRHVATTAGGLGGLQGGGGLIELTLIYKHIDLSEPVSTVEGEPHGVWHIPGLPVGHDHSQVFLELSDVGVRGRAIFGAEIFREISRRGGIGFHPTLIFREIGLVSLSPHRSAR